MANHSLPTQTSGYINFVQELDNRFDDLARGLDPAKSPSGDPTISNLPVDSVGWSSQNNKWRKWNGSTWVDLVTNDLYGINISGNAGSVNNGVYTTGAQTIGGVKTFTSQITGDISGNAGSVNNGVYTTGNQTIGGIKTFSSQIQGSISGIAGSVNNGVYTIGDQTIGGVKTFLSDLNVNGDISLNGGDLTSTATSGTMLNSNVLTLAIGSAATSMSLGATTGTFTIRNPNIATSITTGILNLFPSISTGTLNLGSNNAGKLALLFNTASTSSNTGAFTVNGGIGIGGVSYFGSDVFLSGTGALKVASGTTAERPTGEAGKVRFNTSIAKYEGHNGSIWSSLGGGATGGNNDDIFYENSSIVTANYTITSGKNAMTAGPITINDGITVTVPDNSSWTIV